MVMAARYRLDLFIYLILNALYVEGAAHFLLFSSIGQFPGFGVSADWDISHII